MILNFASAWAFYFATYFVHLGAEKGSAGPVFYAFVRYLLGFLIFLSLGKIQGLKLSWRAPRFVLSRSIFNTVAVFCFYQAVALGSTGKANVLNMTYPAFVALFAGLILGEYPDKRTLIIVAISMIGILISLTEPVIEYGGFSFSDFWGLASAILAAFAVIALRGARKESDSSIILIWMFGFGTFALLPFSLGAIKSFPGPDVLYILSSAILGVLGQWFLTLSYKHIDATAGSVISSSRIPIAVLAGFFLLSEPFSIPVWSGALFIFLANLLLAFPKQR